MASVAPADLLALPRLRGGAMLPARDHWVWSTLAVLTIAVLFRAATFGDPFLDFDEQLYLVVGDRMLHGQLPYIDMWDRKPLGLFLFFAAIRWLGGEGVVQYQVAAALCAGGTACLIHAMARRLAGDFGALVVAVAYLFVLTPLHGAGGQSPVLYNLLTAGAAWLTLQSNDIANRRSVIRLALGAMALMGMAIQFKYTPFVEGAFFGCYFLYRFHRIGMSLTHIIAVAAGMVVVALLPTLAVVLFYWSIGHLDAFVQANILSIFERDPFPPETRLAQRLMVSIIGGPLVLVALVAGRRCWSRRHDFADGDAAMLIGWCVAAAIGFAMLGDFYDFYFITLALPLATLAAAVVKLRPAGVAAAALLMVWPLMLARPAWAVTRSHRDAAERLTAAIAPHVRDRCLYVNDGPTVLYMLTGACVPTRYLYPDHLTNPTEAPALGVDPVVETRRILATRPGAIVTADVPLIPRVNRATHALVQQALARDYRLVARVEADRVFSVWALDTARRYGTSTVSSASGSIPG